MQCMCLVLALIPAIHLVFRSNALCFLVRMPGSEGNYSFKKIRLGTKRVLVEPEETRYLFAVVE